MNGAEKILVWICLMTVSGFWNSLLLHAANAPDGLGRLITGLGGVAMGIALYIILLNWK